VAQQIINTGTVADDGTGDPLRLWATKTNANFTEVYASLVSVVETFNGYQPLNPDLTAIGALTTEPYGRNLLTTYNEAQFKDLVNLTPGVDVQAHSAVLDALAAYNVNGFLVQTAADTFTARSIAAPAAGISISNGNGVAGNPTLALANDLAALEALTGTNTLYYRSGADTWSPVTIGAGVSFSVGVLSASAAAPQSHVAVFDTSGNFTTPVGTDASTVFKFRIQAGGGGGGGADGAGAVGGGGQAGGFLEGHFSGLAVGTVVPIAIGVAGAAGASTGGNGGIGGDTSIGGAIGAITGGGAGGAGNTGASTTGSEGGNGGGGWTLTGTGVAVLGINGRRGGRGWSTGPDVGVAGEGADSQMGGGGIPGSLNVAQAGTAGTGYGAGGAGAFLAGTAGTPGRPGLAIIEWVQ